MKSAQEKRKNFEINSMMLFAFMMVANVCNYLFQIITGRLLTVSDYGTVNTLMSLIVYFSIPNTIISMIAARYIALYRDMNHKNQISSVIRLLLKCGVIIALIIALIGVVFAKTIANTFHLQDSILVYGCAAVAVINVLAAIMYGVLQGLQFFLPYGIQGIVNAVCKLLFSIVFILLGYKAGGVVAAMIIGAMLTVFYCVYYIRGELVKAIRYKGESVVEFREFVRFAIGMIIAQSSIIMLTNGDILLVKALFDDTVAGTYSSAMVIGKIAMYISTAVTATLFPMVVEENGKGHDTVKLFKKALLYGGGSSVIMALGMNLLGRYVIGILFGQRYLEAIQYLPAVCMFVVPLTFLTVIMNYVLAIDKVRFFAISAIGSVMVMLLLVWFFHTNVTQVMMICGGVLLIDVAANLAAIMIMISSRNIKLAD